MPGTKCFTHLCSAFSQPPSEEGHIITPILQKRKLRLREVAVIWPRVTKLLNDSSEIKIQIHPKSKSLSFSPWVSLHL